MSETGRWAIRVAVWLIAATPAVTGAAAQLAIPAPPPPISQPVATGDLPAPMPDGRMLGHIPYAEAARTDLIAAPPGFAIGGACLVHRDAAPDLTRMLAAAAGTPGVGKTLRGISCYRSIAHQRAVFCRGAKPGVCGNPALRARSVGPPGYSEHATGYAIDFGIRPSPGCRDVDACIATSPAGRWLIAHAAEYGYELSFPVGNAQGVTWEPWHWRWVGATANALGAARARTLFARARSLYPANPAVADALPIVWITPPTIWPTVRPPAALPPPAAPRAPEFKR